VFPLDISLGYFPFKTLTSEKLFVATMRDAHPPAFSSTSSGEISDETDSNDLKRDRGRQQARMDDMTELLRTHDLHDFTQLFKDEEIDRQSFVMMTDEDLKAIGVEMGPRHKMMSIIRDHDRQSAMDQVPSNPQQQLQSPELHHYHHHHDSHQHHHQQLYQQHHKSRPLGKGDERVLRSQSSTSSTASFSSLTIDPDELTFFDIIGRGSFGVVHKYGLFSVCL